MEKEKKADPAKSTDGGKTEAKAGGDVEFKIKKWDAVALWSWDIVVDTCAICRNHIMSACIECQAKDPPVKPEDCKVAWGKCNHAFHFHCISRWLQSRHTCPLDNREWVFLKYGR
jgi:E3 ubiquitin-protein ligase RBX1